MMRSKAPHYNHTSHYHARVARVLIHGVKYRFFHIIIFYGAKYHSITPVDLNIFNTLNMFLYIKKINFSYLTNVDNTHIQKMNILKEQESFSKT